MMLKTSGMRSLAEKTAAVASARLGSASSVCATRPLGTKPGRSTQFVQKDAVALRVIDVLLISIKDERPPISGEVNPPNCPGGYPCIAEKTETIMAETGNVVWLEFTSFPLFACLQHSQQRRQFCCRQHRLINDSVKITDGNGKVLVDESCENSSISHSERLPFIVTRTNTVHFFFKTTRRGPEAAVSLKWVAVPASFNVEGLASTFILASFDFI